MNRLILAISLLLRWGTPLAFGLWFSCAQAQTNPNFVLSLGPTTLTAGEGNKQVVPGLTIGPNGLPAVTLIGSGPIGSSAASVGVNVLSPGNASSPPHFQIVQTVQAPAGDLTQSIISFSGLSAIGKTIAVQSVLSVTYQAIGGLSGGYPDLIDTGINIQFSDGSKLFECTVDPSLAPEPPCVVVPPGGYTSTGWSITRSAVTSVGGGLVLTLSGGSGYTATLTTDIEVQGVSIHSIEVTQAIQQWQSLNDLKTCLQAGESGTCQAGEPPVPIIANKPAVLRVYLNQVSTDTSYTVNVSGAVSDSQTLTLEPQCTPELQRQRQNGCQSFDFYFPPPGPPEGQWMVTVNLLDSSGNQIDTEPLTFSSRKTEPLILKEVSVCDAKNAQGAWLCAPASALNGHLGLIRKLYPTNSVTAQAAPAGAGFVTLDSSLHQPVDGVGGWWDQVIAAITRLYSRFDSLSPSSGQHVTYYGMVRPMPEPPGGTLGQGILAPGGPAAASRSQVTWANLFGSPVAPIDVTDDDVAHENGHSLGLRHTNQGPLHPAGPPCYGRASDPQSTWPYQDNYIQSDGPSPAEGSSPALEVGFDLVADQPVLQPQFEIMSYCVPRWISPFNYTNLANLLGTTVPTAAPSALTQAARAAAPRQTPSAGTFWTVSGKIVNNAVTFDPLFQGALNGPSDPGSGSYRIVVLDASGNVLFTRQFTPFSATTDTSGQDYQSSPMFAELIPVQPKAAQIVVIDPTNAQIGALVLTGTLPTVMLISPTSSATLNGAQNVTWSIADPDSTTFTTQVLYSTHNGGGWTQLGEIASTLGTNSFAVDFDTLPGGSAQIMLWVSDGINTGQATSSPFIVPKKNNVTAQILSPSPNGIFRSGALVTLQVNAYDVDDGVLDGSAVQWTSNLNGALGSGANLGVTTLHPGQHQITVIATDSDGNAATQVVPIIVAGSGPTINLSVAGSQAAPTTCAQVSIQAAPGSVPLSQVAYSLDTGMTWTGLPITATPLTFTLSGSGAFYVIAHAIDIAGQLASKDAKFSTTGACQSQQSLPPLANVNAASFSPGPLAAESLVTVFGSGLATGTAPATSVPLPTALDGTTVTVTDSSGNVGLASLFYVSPGQLNYQIPAGMAAGAASVAIANRNGSVSIGTLQLVPVAPGLFSANADGKGVAAAIALQVAADGTQAPVPAFQCSAASGCVSVPIDLGPSTDQLALELFGTGIRGLSSLANVTCTVGGAVAKVLSTSAQGQFVGLDQVNVIIPRSLAGRGEVPVSLVVDGQAANTITVNIK